jgi:hypothetical protein
MTPLTEPPATEGAHAIPKRSTLYFLALALTFCVLLVPIWIVNYPGMIDYPNHLARCYILAHFHSSPSGASAISSNIYQFQISQWI